MLWKREFEKSEGGASEPARIVNLQAELKRLRKKNKRTARIVEELNENGHSCGRDKARRLMKLACGPSGRAKKEVQGDDRQQSQATGIPEPVARKFEVSAPNRTWVSDITYIWTSEGWLSLAVVLDLFQRKIVGWSISHRINKQLVMDGLRMGIWRCRPNPGLIFHSDRGSQYCGHDFLDLLKTHKMLSSMSRKDNCWDNVEALDGRRQKVFSGA